MSIDLPDRAVREAVTDPVALLGDRPGELDDRRQSTPSDPPAVNEVVRILTRHEPGAVGVPSEPIDLIDPGAPQMIQTSGAP